YDAHLGMYHLRARDYNTSTGTFVTPDPMSQLEKGPSDPLALHMYLYTPDDPVNFADPSGRFGIIDVLSAAGIDTMFSSIQFTGFSAVYKVVEGVEAGLTANQVFASFLIDQLVQ